MGGHWREAYNKRRPHSAFGYLNPAASAAASIQDFSDRFATTGGVRRRPSRQ
jgi:transposase InsO family protein